MDFIFLVLFVVCFIGVAILIFIELKKTIIDYNKSKQQQNKADTLIDIYQKRLK